MSKKDMQSACGGVNLSGGENIEQIRQLLFGPQVKALENKIAALDEKTSEALQSLQNDLNTRLDTVEAYMKSELESLLSSLDSERKKRDGAQEQLSNKDKEMEQALEKAGRDMREFVVAQGKTLSEEVQRKHQQASDELKRAVATLRDEHVDRAMLSSLFTETALKLGDGLIESMLGEAAAPDEE